MKKIKTEGIIIGKSSLVMYYNLDSWIVLTTDGLFTYSTDEIMEVYNYSPKQVTELKQEMFKIQDNINLIQ
jgi:hypothetical protein